jgi:hypothetical protein
MVVVPHVVFLLVSVEAVVGLVVDATPFETTSKLGLLASPSLTLLDVEVVNCRYFCYFFLFEFCKIRS